MFECSFYELQHEGEYSFYFWVNAFFELHRSSLEPTDPITQMYMGPDQFLRGTQAYNHSPEPEAFAWKALALYLNQF